MTRNENRQCVRNKAMNKIIKAHGKNSDCCDQYDTSSYGEQRDKHVSYIILEMLHELKEVGGAGEGR